MGVAYGCRHDVGQLLCTLASDIIFEYQMLIQISCSFMLAAICLSSCWNLYVAFSVSSLSMTCFIG